jgi:hypothetical protein
MQLAERAAVDVMFASHFDQAFSVANPLATHVRTFFFLGAPLVSAVTLVFVNCFTCLL